MSRKPCIRCGGRGELTHDLPPRLDGDGERFASVCHGCNGEGSISTDAKGECDGERQETESAGAGEPDGGDAGAA